MLSILSVVIKFQILQVRNYCSYLTKIVEISGLKYPTHYTPQGDGDVFYIVLHKNVRLTDVIVSDTHGTERSPTTY